MGLQEWDTTKAQAAAAAAALRFHPWVGKIPWRREWQPTPVFLPGESHREGAWQYAVHAVTELDTTEQLTHVEIINMHEYSYTYFIGKLSIPKK